MPQAIVYCDRCGKIVPPSLQGAGAIISQNVVICTQCAKSLLPEERAQIAGKRKTPAPGQKERHSSRVRMRSAQAGASHVRRNTALVVAGSVAGVVFGLVISLAAFLPKHSTEVTQSLPHPGPAPLVGTVDVPAPTQDVVEARIAPEEYPTEMPPPSPEQPTQPAQPIAEIRAADTPPNAPVDSLTAPSATNSAALASTPDTDTTSSGTDANSPEGPSTQRAQAEQAEQTVAETAPAKTAPASIDKDLVGWWKFDDGGGEIAADSSGNGHHGKLTGMDASAGVWTSGKSGGALAFDGNGGAVVVGDSRSAFNLNGRSFTIAFWLCKGAEVRGHTFVVVKGKGAHPGWGVTATPQLDLATSNNEEFFSFEEKQNFGTVAPGEWAHLAATYDSATNTVATFRNGEAVERRQTKGVDMKAIDVADADLCFGARGPQTPGFFQGKLDDVRIYARTLAPEEIRALVAPQKASTIVKAFVPGPPIQDFVSSLDRRDKLHVVYVRSGALWYVRLEADLKPGEPALIGRGLINPSMLVLRNGAVLVTAYDSDQKRLVQAMRRSTGPFAAQPVRFAGPQPELQDPHPYLAATATTAYLFFYGSSGDSVGGLLYSLHPATNSFTLGGKVTGTTIFRDVGRPTFVTMHDGRAALLFCAGQFVELYWLRPGAKTFDAAGARSLAARTETQILDFGAAIDPLTGLSVVCDQNGVLHQIAADGAARSWPLKLKVEHHDKGPNRRTVATAPTGEAFFVHRGHFYRRSAAGEWTDSAEARRLDVTLSETQPQVHYQIRPKRFLLVGTHRGALLVYAYDPASNEPELAAQVNGAALGAALADAPLGTVEPNGRKAEPATTVGEAPNLLVNGGFEELDATTKFAARWKPYQWGRPSARGYARMDRTNAHTGDRALVIQAIDEDSKPGAFIALTRPLQPGRYSIDVWACAETADSKSSKSLVVSLAGTEAPAISLGEDWRSTTVTIELKQRASPAVLRIWSTSPRVRVWVDDVTVHPLQ